MEEYTQHGAITSFILDQFSSYEWKKKRFWDNLIVCVCVCVCLVQFYLSIYVSCISVFEQADKISRNVALQILPAHVARTNASTHAHMNKWMNK